MNRQSALDNLSIVLVRTKTPGNIGAVCRCMMNMGLSRLVLVRPPDHLAADALRMALAARPILESAAVFVIYLVQRKNSSRWQPPAPKPSWGIQR